MITPSTQNDILSQHLDEYEIPSSPETDTDAIFQEAMLLATLADRFDCTRFKSYQKDVIQGVLNGRDALVIQPTGSGKSLCFQFPAVHQQKKAVVLVPTISLMEDHVQNLHEKGISSAYLGSAQTDKGLEDKVFQEDSEEKIIFVTPEWLSKPERKARVRALAEKKALSLIAVDEAHLVFEWENFRPAYKEIQNLKYDFPTIPIMLLTATAPPQLETNLRGMLHNPVISKGSINRPNIELRAEECPKSQEHPYQQFAKRVKEIVGRESGIIYTDFVNDVGPILSAVSNLGFEAVGYYGEMDVRSKTESYTKWRSGAAQLIVATKAFGMGINRKNVRHIIRNGVPESISSWAQELGRGGRDGLPATATILYSMEDIGNAKAWIKDHLRNYTVREQVLADYSEVWRYVLSHTASQCRRKTLLTLFGEDGSQCSQHGGKCCDICESDNTQTADYTGELADLISCLDTLGAVGEVKASEWIRGSNASWTDRFDKTSPSFGSGRSHSQSWWRNFMRACHVLGYAQRQLKSIIKHSGHYAIQPIYVPTQLARSFLEEKSSLTLPIADSVNTSTCSSHNHSTASNSSEDMNGDSQGTATTLKRRVGKGSHLLTTIRQLLKDSATWEAIKSKEDYHFPGMLKSKKMQTMFFTPDCSQLPQYCQGRSHFIWEDIQLSKGKLNKDRLIEVTIDNDKLQLYYRSAPCNGVKQCSAPDCMYTAPLREKRPCQAHPSYSLVKTENCPVDYAYLYPPNFEKDKWRWVAGLVRNQNESTDNLHNHPMHGASKISAHVSTTISQAVKANPSLTPSDIQTGKGIGFIPAAVDGASSHLGKISRIVSKTRQQSPLLSHKWSVEDFENIADEIDATDKEHVGDSGVSEQQYKKLGRPYLRSVGIEDGVKYLLTMSPLMCDVFTTADFIESDVTYDENTEYRYLMNVVAFNVNTMEWMVVARVRLSSETAEAYKIAFQKTQQDSSRREKPSRRYHTRYSQNGQIVFLSSSSSFRRASSTSTQSLMMVFARNSSISHRVVHLVIAFSQPPSLHQAAAAAHSITMASLVTPFFRLYACAIT